MKIEAFHCVESKCNEYAKRLLNYFSALIAVIFNLNNLKNPGHQNAPRHEEKKKNAIYHGINWLEIDQP